MDLNELAAAIGNPETDKPITNRQRKDFNAYTDWLEKRGMKGNPSLDKNNLGRNLLQTYIKEHPGTSLTPDIVIPLQNDMTNYRKWSMDNIISGKGKFAEGEDEENYMSDLRVVDGSHSRMSAYKFPDEYMSATPDPGQPSDEELTKFADWTGSGGLMDTKVAAQDLKRRGLIGAEQIIDAPVDTSDPGSVKNSQADWKPAAIQEILSNAYKLGIKTPQEIKANKDVLLRTSKYKEAVNNSSFGQIHPNFWDVIADSILPEQYSKLEKEKAVIAKK